jgi:Lipoprotein confined to pathogenic Mycobacterium
MLALSAALTACSNPTGDDDMLSFGEIFEDDGVDEETTWRAIDELMNLPSLEEKMSEYQTMLEEMKTHIATVIPNIEWDDIPEENYTGPCSGDYLFTNGESKTIRWFGRPALDEAAFSQVSDIVLPIAAKYGFTERGGAGKDTPEFRIVRVFGPQGSDFVLNTINDDTEQGSTLIVGTGCYMEEATKENLRTIGIPFAEENNRWPWDIPDQPCY